MQVNRSGGWGPLFWFVFSSWDCSVFGPFPGSPSSIQPWGLCYIFFPSWKVLRVLPASTSYLTFDWWFQNLLSPAWILTWAPDPHLPLPAEPLNGHLKVSTFRANLTTRLSLTPSNLPFLLCFLSLLEPPAFTGNLSINPDPWLALALHSEGRSWVSLDYTHFSPSSPESECHLLHDYAILIVPRRAHSSQKLIAPHPRLIIPHPCLKALH